MLVQWFVSSASLDNMNACHRSAIRSRSPLAADGVLRSKTPHQGPTRGQFQRSDRNSQQTTMKTHHQNGAEYQANMALTCTLIFVSIMLGAGSLMAKPRTPVPPWPEPGLLCFESFDQPCGTPTNQVIDATVWAESWSGYCLDRCSSPVAPWVIPMVVTNRLQADPANGAIRFWYHPGFDSGNGPGHTATLPTLASRR